MTRAVAALALAALLAAGCAGPPAQPEPPDAFPADVLDSVVSVLPAWPAGAEAGDGGPGEEPEGSAVAVAEGGLLVTALHVIRRAEDVQVRLADGRVRPARVVGRDRASDLALLRAETELPPLAWGAEPKLGEPVCAVGNAFGLGLTVSCGVVSATHQSGLGFNPIEDFVQTDAAVNPGASGGALVDEKGRLVGIVSAIFTKRSDANIGVNFAASRALVERVVADLAAHGRVRRADPGLRVGPLPDSMRGELAGARVTRVVPGGAAAAAGLEAGDVIVVVDGRAIREPAAVTAAVHLHPPGEAVALVVVRDGARRRLTLELPAEP